MKIKSVKLQECKDSFFLYVPKVWINEQGIIKGDKMIWTIDEGDHSILHLKKVV